MRLVSQAEIENNINFSEALKVIEASFVAASEKKVILPPPLVFALGETKGEICIKTAYDGNLPTYTIKQVSVFQDNPKKGLPSLTGTMNVYSSATGELLAVLNENGWLTNVRTACAGTIANKYFSQSNATTLGVVGASTQAFFQLKILLSQSKNYQTVFLWNRTKDKLDEFITKITKIYPNINFIICNTVADVVKKSDTIITCTSSRLPLLMAEMVEGGKTIIGIGADMPEKYEIEGAVFQKADRIFVDNKDSNFVLGDIANAVSSKNITKEKITGEIGEVISGKKKGRDDDDQLIIVKLVGIGAQDTYIGNYVYQSIVNSTL